MKTGEAKSRRAAARQRGVHRDAIANWLDLYEDEGLEKPREIGEPGPEPGQQSIPSDIMEDLKPCLYEPEGFDSYKEIQQWLADQHNLDLHYMTVHRIVRYDLEAELKAP